MRKEQREIIVAPDLAALVDIAAMRIAKLLSGNEPRMAICLTGGSTPKPVYQRLTAAPYRDRIPWERTHWFWGDDRFVPREDERSNARMARLALLDHLPIPSSNIHPIPTNVPNQHDAARLYEAELKRFYGDGHLLPNRPLFDLVLLGIGSDGHTASLFPGDPAVVERKRWVAGIDVAGLPPHVPRVSLTFPILGSTREMMFLVSGNDKKNIVTRVFSGQDLPAAQASAEGHMSWLMDRNAASEKYLTSSRSGEVYGKS